MAPKLYMILREVHRFNYRVRQRTGGLLYSGTPCGGITLGDVKRLAMTAHTPAPVSSARQSHNARECHDHRFDIATKTIPCIVLQRQHEHS